MRTRYFRALLVVLAMAPGHPRAAAYEWQYRLIVEVRDKDLLAHEHAAVARFPLKGSMRNDGGDIRVFDADGNRCAVLLKEVDRNASLANVVFATNSSARYEVQYGDPDARTETESGIYREGRVLIEDWIHPDARTSGVWLWKRTPRLGGLFSHADTGNPIAFHSAAFPVPFRYTVADSLGQYVYSDAHDPPRELMVEIWSGRERTFFSWGEDVIQWRGLTKTPMGTLPPAGSWQRIEIPLKEMKKDGEISGIGFYRAGGTVFWDRTTVRGVPLETDILRWEERGNPIASYFTAETSGPFEKDGNRFFLISLDASASLGATSVEWTIEGQRLHEEKLLYACRQSERLSVALSVARDGASRDSFTREILLPSGAPMPLNVSLSSLPHPNFIAAGEKIVASFLVTSLTPVPVPLSICCNGETRLVTVLPGKLHRQTLDVALSGEHETDTSVLEISCGGMRLSAATVLLRPLSTSLPFDCEGPYFRTKEGRFVVLEVPEYSWKQCSTAGRKELSLGLVGGVPPGLAALLVKACGEKGITARVETVDFPPADGYRVLKDFLFLRAATGAQLDAVFLLPSPSSLVRGTPVEEWRRWMDALVFLLRGRTDKVILVSPFPSAPSPRLFAPHEKAADVLARKRNVDFIALSTLYTKTPSWEKLFMKTEGIYVSVPNEEGLKLLCARMCAALTQP